MSRRRAVRTVARHAAGRVMDGIVAAGCSLSVECLRWQADARDAASQEASQGKITQSDAQAAYWAETDRSNAERGL